MHFLLLPALTGVRCHVDEEISSEDCSEEGEQDYAACGNGGTYDGILNIAWKKVPRGQYDISGEVYSFFKSYRDETNALYANAMRPLESNV